MIINKRVRMLRHYARAKIITSKMVLWFLQNYTIASGVIVARVVAVIARMDLKRKASAF